MWSHDLQTEKNALALALIAACRNEIGNTRAVSSETDPCHQLGICDEDLDDIQISAAATRGLRLPYPGEPLVMPWYGTERRSTIDDIAGWIAVNARPLD